MKMTKQWYAVYTRPRWEKKVAEQLTKKKIETFCPLNRVVRQWSDRKKTIMEPMFASYVFVHVFESEFLSIKQTDGVLNMVYWLGRPAVIRDEEINVIERFLGEYSNVKLEQTEVSLEDNVRIISGPLMSVAGKVMQVKPRTVKILLPSLGYAMVAEVKRSEVELVSEAPVHQMYSSKQPNGTL